MFPMRDVESCEGHEPRAIAFERHESGILREQSFDSIGEKMTLELQPTYVYPDEFGTMRGSGFAVPSPHLMVARMVEERSIAYGRGDWSPMFQRHAKAMRNNKPIPYGLDGFITGDIKVAYGADRVHLKNQDLSTLDAWTQGIKEGTKIKDLKELAVENEFSGNVFTPFAALAHWLVGDGKPTSVKIENTGIRPTPDKIPDLKAIIDTAGIGETSVKLKVPYSTGQDSQIARVYLGNITISVEGTVVHTTSGKVTFNGTVKAFSDRYDANASSHRAQFDEGATSALREIGRVANAKDYEIKITGALPINFSR